MIHELNALYLSRDLQRCRLSRFEDYDFYSGVRDFLQDKSILTFTDLDGRLRVLRPDATLSLIRRGRAGKWFYLEKVYRPDQNSHRFTELNHAGVDFLGVLSDSEISQTIQLALDSLEILARGKNFVLDIADCRQVAKFVNGRSDLLGCLQKRDIQGLLSLNAPSDLIKLLENPTLNPENGCVLKFLDNPRVSIDFSVVSNLKYYNGLVMEGYIEGVGSCVLRGGQYDGLLRSLRSPMQSGIGFAIYLDEVEDFEND